MRSPALLATFIASLLCAACTSDPKGTDETSSGPETTASDTSTTEAESETGSDACAGHDDAALDPALQIVVSNTRETPAYLMTADDCTFNHVHVSGDAGHWPPGDCEPTCAQMMDGNCACPGACPAPQLLRIEAGSSYALDWPYVLAPDSVAEICVDPNLCGAGDCPRAIVPPDGSYTISVDVLYAPTECEGVGDPCACPMGESWCVTSVIVGGGTPPDLDLDLMTTLPGGGLELVIE